MAETELDRKILLDRLFIDLIGPVKEDERLESKPSDTYITGILWPRKTKMGAEDDERLGFGGDTGSDEGASSGDTENEAVSVSSMNRPSAAGVSFAVSASKSTPFVKVVVTFGVYEPEETKIGGNGNTGEKVKARTWNRKGLKIEIPDLKLKNDEFSSVDLSRYGASPGTELHVRTAKWKESMLATLTLVNNAVPDENEGRQGMEKATLFQTRIEIRPCSGTILIARPSRKAIIDEDDRSDALLYRSALEFAVGHTCSAEWEAGDEHGTASVVATTWIPRALVPGISADGHSVFDCLRKLDGAKPLSAEWLASADGKKMSAALGGIPEAYLKWIALQEKALDTLEKPLRDQAEINLNVCREVAARMSKGVLLIKNDPAVAEAFRLANKAMRLQHSWDREKSSRGPLQWRPFQLGFILLSLPSVAKNGDEDRYVMDLLWFPTGGGKTEAYLALVAFLAFHRRLSGASKPDEGAGVCAVMRYTLRLLTTQQFVRASAMILACEMIRRKYSTDGKKNRSLGHIPFSIGLWVGGEATPNKYSQAAASLAGSTDVPSPKQLSECPCCGKGLEWRTEPASEAIRVNCVNSECDLYSRTKPLPVFTVDSDIYRERPTLLIGTIDKFAQIVRRKEITALFSFDKGTPPDLIIQDELHLISGPLGTIAGLYETAIDLLFSKVGSPVKIIGSTATIRRAQEQVKNLFNRGICQFPPPAINSGDSGFAVVDETAPGRLYAGVTTAGRSAKFTLQALAASLLQSAFASLPDNTRRDPYWTLVLYFNALRELGGAVVLMQDDVNDSLKMIAARRGEDQRNPKMIEELTSRRTQEEVRDMLTKMSLRTGMDGALDAVLATNMMSVGVDIPRLGLMLMNGQPKGIAEYIQATSRIGRGRVPGLVVAVLNNAKARDRSHYEAFGTWHGTLYRDVEATSVTPFASRARDRALHAALVALIRHAVPGMLESPRLDKKTLAAAQSIIEEITKRASFVDREETEVSKELKKLLNRWDLRDPQYYWNKRAPNRSLLQDAERAATMRALGRLPGSAWPTMNNMRSVEPGCRFRIAQSLKKYDSE